MVRFYTILFIIILAYIPVFISAELLDTLTEEDGFYEGLGALSFLVSAIIFCIYIFRPGLSMLRGFYKPLSIRKYYVLFGLISFFAFGEEISWGQRILNFSTPEFMNEINAQGEFNIHNIAVFHGRNMAGEKKTGLEALFTMNRMFYVICIGYLFLVPLFSRLSIKIRHWLNHIALPIPELSIGILFIFNMSYGKFIEIINPDLESHAIVEIKECVMALIILILPLSWLNLKKQKTPL